MPRFFPRFLGQHPGLCRCPCQCQMPGSECQITISSSTCRGGIISSMPAPFPFPCGWKTRSCVTWLSSPSLSLTVHLSPDANCFSWSFVFAPLSRVRVALEKFLAQQIITYTYVWPGYYLLVWVTPIISQLNRLKVRSKKKAEETELGDTILSRPNEQEAIYGQAVPNFQKEEDPGIWVSLPPQLMQSPPDAGQICFIYQSINNAVLQCRDSCKF